MAMMKDIYTEYEAVFDSLNLLVNETDPEKRREIADEIHDEICVASMGIISLCYEKMRINN